MSAHWPAPDSLYSRKRCKTSHENSWVHQSSGWKLLGALGGEGVGQVPTLQKTRQLHPHATITAMPSSLPFYGSLQRHLTHQNSSYPRLRTENSDELMGSTPNSSISGSTNRHIPQQLPCWLMALAPDRISGVHSHICSQTTPPNVLVLIPQ